MTHWTRWTSRVYSEHFIIKQQNTQSYQMHMEHCPEQITYWVQIRSQLVPKDWDHSLHIFRPQCFETQSQEESWKELKYLEAKEHLTEE